MGNDSSKSRVERCRQEVDANPDSAKARFNLGLAYTQQGRVAPAEQAYREALRLDPDLVEAWVNLGGTLMLKWDFRGSIEANSEALQRDGEAVLAHFNIGQASVYLGDGEGVVRANRRVIELEPSHAAAHYFLAVGLLSTGHPDQAREAVALAKALGHSPSPEFLRALEHADPSDPDPETRVETIGAETPQNPNRR